MHHLYYITLFCLHLCSYSFPDADPNVNHLKTLLKPSISTELQENEVKSIIERLLGEHKSKIFDIKIVTTEKDDFFTLERISNTLVRVTAPNAVSAAYGVHHYLKYYCHCHISWDADQLALPEILPDVSVTLKILDKVRYYQNVCTESYSYVWWNWDRWRREIDWMALNGINAVLTFTGQEAIWKRVYETFNLIQKDIDEHFTGPPFQSWGRMGNIRGWGGPLSSEWHVRTVKLQHQILQSLRNLGITPILPCFSGHVPRAFRHLYPDSAMQPLTRWVNFEDKFCCPFILDPQDPLFNKVGSEFMKQLKAEFGTNHIYQCDMFNEMEPSSTDTGYLSNISSAVYNTMLRNDPKAVWFMQGWTFAYQMHYWTPDRVQALLSGVPNDRLVILDLQSELNPQYERLEFYFGKLFIWCMLHNFGGTLGLHGSSDIINENIPKVRRTAQGAMAGIGLTMEGINQNYVMYDLMLEMPLHKEPIENLDNWFQKYSKRRYGEPSEPLKTAWMILRRSVYNYKGTKELHGQYTLCVRPSLNLISQIWYDPKDFAKALDLFSNSTVRSRISQTPTYAYDLVDMKRQSLQLTFDVLYQKVIESYKKRHIALLHRNGEMLLELLKNLEKLLSSHKSFMLGNLLREVRKAGYNEVEKDRFEENTRNQLTLWGPKGEILDYATKQWAGIVIDYYYPRWELFLNLLEGCLKTGENFNQTYFNNFVFNVVEKPFTMSKKCYPATPIYDPETA